MKKIIILLTVILGWFSVGFSQQDTSKQKFYLDSDVVIISNNKDKLEESIENLQNGIKDFSIKIDKKNNEIKIWKDSIMMLNIQIAEDSTGKTEKIIDSLNEKIKNNEDIIEALTEGIEDIEQSIEELQKELNEISEDTIKINIKPKDKLKKRKFKGHWAGMQLGLNTFVYNNSPSLPPESSFLTIDQLKSWEFAINPFQFSIPFFNRYVGAVTGIGFTFNNYELLNNVTLSTLNNDLVATYDSTYIYDKNRLKTASLTLPLILEFQFRTNKKDKRFYIGTGVIGSLNLSTKMKYVYKRSNIEIKSKDKTTIFPVNRFSYAATVRLGLDDWYLYANYSLLPMFVNNPIVNNTSFGIGLKF